MGDEEKMQSTYNPNVWGLGNASPSLMDESDKVWEKNKSIRSQRNEPKLDPIGDLAQHAKDSEKRGKENDAIDRNGFRAIMDKGIRFTDPVTINAGMPSSPKGKLPRNEDPARGNGTGAGVDHDWKITSAAVDEATLNRWTVATGKVYYFNDATEALVLSTSIEGGTGSIYLHIVRNPATRLVTAQTVEFLAAVPFTGESDQYIELGAISVIEGIPSLIQKQFTPIRVYEDLFVINGEFKLGNIAMLADNLYAPPA